MHTGSAVNTAMYLYSAMNIATVHWNVQGLQAPQEPILLAEGWGLMSSRGRTIDNLHLSVSMSHVIDGFARAIDHSVLSTDPSAGVLVTSYPCQLVPRSTQMQYCLVPRSSRTHAWVYAPCERTGRIGHIHVTFMHMVCIGTRKTLHFAHK